MMQPEKGRDPNEKAVTRSGARKPGSTSSGESLNMSRNINLGADNDNENNPLTMIINTAKKAFNG